MATTYGSKMHKILHFKSLTSTQDKAKELAKKGLNNIIVISDVQTKGRGRFKRKWHSGKNGLYMSVLLKPENIWNLQYLTFAAAVAVVKSIKKIAGIKAKIKWPNDVHYKGRKLCGILTEGVFGKNNTIVVGIGLNVNNKSFPKEIKDTAASLMTIKHEIFSNSDLAESIIKEFFSLYGHYNKNKPDKIAKIWKAHCDTINKDIAVTTRTRKIYGKAIGIDRDCRLLLKLKNNKIVSIVEGDIKIRY